MFNKDRLDYLRQYCPIDISVIAHSEVAITHETIHVFAVFSRRTNFVNAHAFRIEVFLRIFWPKTDTNLLLHSIELN